ncbi:MAG: adenylate/guanylate cyclase domain-containing protein [Microscillaceae bacterium]|nr:adenylate/guanylate cyclase domain-containing protein [Microscillaceae bacterium]
MMENRKMSVSPQERLEILKNVSIFSQTDVKVLKDIAAAMTEVVLKTEQTIFEKGEEGKDMYVIIEGAVRIHDGAYVFAVLRKGQVFGEYTLLESDAKSRSASVTAIVKTHLLRLSQDVFYKLMADRIEIVKGILKVLIKRSRRQNYFEEKMNEQSVQLEKQRNLIEQEKEKSEKLLLNILPSEVAEELKTYGKAEVRQYEMVSVLFADIKGFTTASEKLPPAQVVSILEIFFTAFDEIISKYNIEKIKTIGDAYMCAAGIPIPNTSNPIDLVLAALEIQRFMKEHNRELLDFPTEELPFWEVRIGINTGPLIAGVIGHKKFSYDIWGDTVNTASRLESSGEVNRVNISGTTYEMIKDFFDCEYRGKIDAKGKGKIDMYFVNAIKKELSLDQSGLLPNHLFKTNMLEMGF